MVGKLIFLEFNELCPPLLEKWMAAGDLPNFKRFYDSSDVFITKPDVDSPVNLEPWIQWYSTHTGVSFEDHKVFHLGDGPKAGQPDIWTILLDSGFRVGNISSMNAAAFRNDGSFFMADPWCTTEAAYPESLQPIQEFVQQNVQEYTQPGATGLSGLVRKIRAGFSLATGGLSPETTRMIARQLTTEKLHGADYWKRVAILDWLLLDVFRKNFRARKPDFSTLFLNSTAHLQHAYWRHMEPEKFDVQAPAEEADTFRDAILFGYQNMDRIIGRLFDLEKDGATLVLMSALSQQAYAQRDGSGGQKFYRPHNVGDTFATFGIDCSDIQPVMTHQYLLRFDESGQRSSAIDALEGIYCGTDRVFGFTPSDDGSLMVGCQIFKDLPEDANLVMRSNNRFDALFSEHFYKIDATKSACHHPDGVLWFKFGQHQRHQKPVSILDVFPTVLDYYSVPWKGERLAGASLLDQCRYRDSADNLERASV
jgi:hypothetical protein